MLLVVFGFRGLDRRFFYLVRAGTAAAAVEEWNGMEGGREGGRKEEREL